MLRAEMGSGWVRVGEGGGVRVGDNENADSHPDMTCQLKLASMCRTQFYRQGELQSSALLCRENQLSVQVFD